MRRTFALLIVLITSLLVGCALPQHNNTLIFSVQRDVGVGVKTPADGTAPSVYLGYKSSEIAWVPLWANKSSGIFKASTMPCTTKTGGVGSCIKGPKFVGDGDTPGRNDSHDAYSTFASFGGDFGASNSKESGQNVSGKMASFFATGVAAQHLARAPQMVGLPNSDKGKDQGKQVSPPSSVQQITDFLKTTGSATQTVTTTPSASNTTTVSVIEFDYLPACAIKIGLNAALGEANQKLLSDVVMKNIKYENFVADLRDKDELKASRDNLGVAASLLQQQLINELKKIDNSLRSAREKVCG